MGQKVPGPKIHNNNFLLAKGPVPYDQKKNFGLLYKYDQNETLKFHIRGILDPTLGVARGVGGSYPSMRELRAGIGPR